MSLNINVTSEISKLNSVLLKRPGREVENLTPDTMHGLLFDDIPYLPIIQQEHDAFADVLKNNGAQVYYLEKLAAEAIEHSKNKEKIVQQFINESNIHEKTIADELTGYLFSMDTQSMVDKIMAGVRNDEVDIHSTSLAWSADHQKKSLFLMQPMPNLYYTRDPANILGSGISINNMTYTARKRESLFMEVIVKYHPDFKDSGLNIWRDRMVSTSIEGGDVLVLSDEVLAIGISQRTSGRAIEELAKTLFSSNSTFKKILAIEIPHVRAMMHLDTVFTMIDTDKFTIHPGIQSLDGKMSVYILQPGKAKDEIDVTHQTDLSAALKAALNLSEIALIPCGGGDAIAAPREQWNDGSNTLAIKPGVVVTYNRNYVSNELMREHGVKVLEIPSSELSRGRGGPRCMSMPLSRD
ncbi:arginine deiminase [Marinilactibacillus sp. 15R]|uniref:Arginine deiminase n=1 Tax=Marinilactibacillus piezotolerans TaxID=258723 RepID=A0A1I3V4A0_9LACT|nr:MULTISPECIES: arginine deiminase [Marinilactibacillus]API89587.1 arginine deiminase [Marinilactibacillus sp. 15R]SFJ90278.1 arginine deiminase [Marinilactibacillus piezotolerans]